MDDQPTEQYSDDEENNRIGIIDIDAVSGLGESAPTSLQRARNLRERIKGDPGTRVKRDKDTKDKGKGKGKGKARDEDMTMGIGLGVKDEPISPEKLQRRLPGGMRNDDIMMDEDEVEDRDLTGRRVRVEEEDDEGVNEAQKVDLSESESEEEEEPMIGDFVNTPGHVGLLLHPRPSGVCLCQMTIG
jgi:DNA-directed RNA polymerase III subunit RPC4